MAVKIDDVETNRGLQAAEIAAQNDRFRAALIDPMAALDNARQGIIGQVLLTPGIAEEGEDFQHSVLMAVAEFNDFTPANDPYGDRTFGALTVAGARVFWRVDLYDEQFEYGSERPWDVTVTRRVLTIMLPSEY